MKRLATDPDATVPPTLPVRAHWQARLTAGFADDHGTTRLIERSHFGPLRIQKPLYPEGPEVCHAIIVHPPGGVVGGDLLSIDASVGDQARALIATPGAAKWYKANGHVSRQEVRLKVGAQGSLEWLPQETIFFNTAHVQLDTRIELAADAQYIGCEILCFGRTASGESFTSGTVLQKNTIRRDGKLIWFEQGAIHGGSEAMQSPLALAGKTVCATLIAVGKSLTPASITALREKIATASNGTGSIGVSQLKSVLVVRYLGDASEIARHVMIGAWQHLRPELLSREAIVPRIWNT